MSRIPNGSGQPVWVDTRDYLSADETRALGNHVIGQAARCSVLGCIHFGGERAHIARKQLGGRQPGKDGPRVRMCALHHAEVDQHAATMCLAVRRSDHAVGRLWSDGRFERMGWA